MSVLLIEPGQEFEALVRRLADDLDIEVTREAGPNSRLVIFDGAALPSQGDLDRIRGEIGPASALLTGDAEILASAATRDWAPLVIRGLLFAPLDEGRLSEQLLDARPTTDAPVSTSPEGILLIATKDQLAAGLREVLPPGVSFEVAGGLTEAWKRCREQRFEAILIENRLTHRRTWERIQSLQPGAHTIALIQRRHSAKRKATTTLRARGSLTLPITTEQIEEALGDVLAPAIPLEEGVRRAPTGASASSLFKRGILKALAEDAVEGATSREVDLSEAELEEEAREELCKEVEAAAGELGIEVSWTHEGDPTGESEDPGGEDPGEGSESDQASG